MRGLVFYCKAAPLSEGLRSGQERIVSRRGGLSSQNAIDHGRFCSDLAPVGERPQVSNDEGLWVTRAALPFLAAVSRARWDGSASHAREVESPPLAALPGKQERQGWFVWWQYPQSSACDLTGMRLKRGVMDADRVDRLKGRAPDWI